MNTNSPTCTLQPKQLPDPIPYTVLVLSSPFSPHLRRFHIGRAFVIRLSQHAHNRNKDLLNGLDRRPSLAVVLVVIWIIAWRVKDRYADQT
jgi:hypothetical protein